MKSAHLSEDDIEVTIFIATLSYSSYFYVEGMTFFSTDELNSELWERTDKTSRVSIIHATISSSVMRGIHFCLFPHKDLDTYKEKKQNGHLISLSALMATTILYQRGTSVT